MLKILLTMTFSGSLLIAVILALRALLQRRVHRTVWLILWALVVLRLLVPVTVAAPTSIFNLALFSAPEAAVSQAPSAQAASVQAASVQTAVPAAAGLPLRVWLPPVLWGCGCALVLLAALALHLKNRRSYRFSLPAPCETALPPRVQVRMLEGLSAPLTYGLFRPVILVPPDLPQNGSRYAQVLQHELAHIRYLDVGFKILLLCAAAVHWFNPLVWLMVYAATQDMEMRADAAAVEALGGRNRRAYAEALVAAEVAKLHGYLETGFAYSSTGSRIKALARDRARRWTSVLAVCVLVPLLLCVFATGRMAAAAPAPEIVPVTEQTAEPSTAAPDTAAVTEETAPETEEPAPETEESVPETEEPAPETEEPAPETEEPAPETAAALPTETAAPTTAAPAPTAPPETTAAPTEAPRRDPAPGGTVYTLGALTLEDGDQKTVTVGTIWTELYSDNPAVLQVSAVWENGGAYLCTLTATRDGSATVYARVDGAWRVFATVTVLP